uniref:Uncharacterized protein n=1 Tax=Anguilla anguilla TaxID=7936 RepID=A0A0E9SCM0_ANGAN
MTHAFEAQPQTIPSGIPQNITDCSD